MYSKRIFLLLTIIVGIILPYSHTQAQGLLQKTGDMDLDGYCRYLGYAGVQLDPTQKNVNGWGCLAADGTQVGLDVFDLCRWQYGDWLPYPEYTSYNDPYSWFCSSEDMSSPATRPTGSLSLSTTAGLCPGYDYSEAPGPWDGINGTQYYYYAGGVLRQEPSITSLIVGQLPDQDGFGWIMDGPLCSANTIQCGNSDRIVWYKLNVDGIVGWYTSCDPIYGYGSSSSGIGNGTPNSEQSVQPVTPESTEVPLPPDGFSGEQGFWCFIPGFCVEAAVSVNCSPQCVMTARSYRKDLVLWGGGGTSDKIIAAAYSQPRFMFEGKMQQVRVRSQNEPPQAGDLVVWPSNCDKAWSGGGHIGYVTNGDPFKISDSNWGNPISESACATRTNITIPIKDCMEFITKPFQTDTFQPTIEKPAEKCSQYGWLKNWLCKLGWIK